MGRRCWPRRSTYSCKDWPYHYKGKKTTVVGMLLLVVAAGIFGAGGWFVDTQRAKAREELTGFFESQPTQVASRIGGRIARILVHEGDTVVKGQTLIELDASPDRDQTLAKQAAARQALEQLREVENGPRTEDILKQEAAVAEARADLARLRNGPRPQEIDQARAAALDAKARLAQAKRGLTPEERAEVKARLDAAVAAETLAVQDAERDEAMYRDGAISRQHLDQARSDLDQKKANRREAQQAWRRADEGTPSEEMEQARQSYKQAKAALDLVLAGSRSEDIRAAEAHLRQQVEALAELKAGSRKEEIAQAKAAARSARDTARSAEINLAEHTVCAPLDGVVNNIPVSEGDLVTTGTALLRLENPADIWVRVYVPEAKLANVRVGSGVQLAIDGISQSVPAYVESVASRGEYTPANLQTPDERGKQVFAVRIRLKRPDARVKAGMYTTVKRIGTWQP